MRARANRLRTAALLAGTSALVLATAALVAGAGGLLLALVAVVAVTTGAYLLGDRVALRAMAARPVGEVEHPRLHHLVRELCTAARQPVPRLYVSPTPAPNAFATGRGPRHAAICLTEGLLASLGDRELRAVLAHELAHIRTRDTLAASVAAGLAGAVTVLVGLAVLVAGEDDDRPGPLGVLVMLVLAPLAAATVHLGISRSRELHADAAAAHATGDPLVLAGALRKIELGVRAMPLCADRQLLNASHLMIACPFQRRGLARLFVTHPPMAERIARLEEMGGYAR